MIFNTKEIVIGGTEWKTAPFRFNRMFTLGDGSEQPVSDSFITQSGDRIVTSAGTPLALDGISSLTTAPSITDAQLTFADDGNSTVSFSMQQLKDYVSGGSAGTTLHQYDRVDGKATVAGFWTDGNGQRYAVCVVDAAYRSGHLYWAGGSDNTTLPNYSSESAVLAAGESATFNMDTIRNNYSLVTYPPFNSAYSNTIELDGVTYNGLLPNAAELQMIYNDKATLDTYDTTLTDYPNNSLSLWNIDNNSNSRCWTSNEHGTYTAWLLNLSGSWEYLGKGSLSGAGVIPIFEIPVDENGTVITN